MHIDPFMIIQLVIVHYLQLFLSIIRSVSEPRDYRIVLDRPRRPLKLKVLKSSQSSRNFRSAKFLNALIYLLTLIRRSFFGRFISFVKIDPLVAIFLYSCGISICNSASVSLLIVEFSDLPSPFSWKFFFFLVFTFFLNSWPIGVTKTINSVIKLPAFVVFLLLLISWLKLLIIKWRLVPRFLFLEHFIGFCRTFFYLLGLSCKEWTHGNLFVSFFEWLRFFLSYFLVTVFYISNFVISSFFCYKGIYA